MQFFDGLLNFVSGLGTDAGKGYANQHVVPIMDHVMLENMYRGSWSARRVLDIPAADMTRKWRAWSESQIDFEREEKRLGLKKAVKRAIIGGRKFGGAGIYMSVAGTGSETSPLDVTKVNKGALTYVTVFTADELTIEEWEEDPRSPRYRRGLLYSINKGSGTNLRIHWTRFAWFGGNAVSDSVRESKEGWDDSVFVSLKDLIENADSALAQLNELLQEAKVDVFKITNLAAHFEDADAEARLYKRMQATQQMKSSVQSVILDADEDYSSKSVTFGGVVDVARFALEGLAGAADIPITRFLGQSPGGLNSTGESNFRNYYDGIHAQQENEIEPALRTLDEVLALSTIGKTLEDVSFTWRNLWTPSPKEKAEIDKIKAETSQVYNNMGIFDPEQFAEGVLAQLVHDEVYPGMKDKFDTDAEISKFIEIEEPKETQQANTPEATASASGSGTSNS